ncbi:hypothetical protein DENSPDRAFT_834050 [Dentipellis sp. KUC8613]|nr:hypothetical protein DENSPDRAFT_834050 [Dentipellis sp. KUC8613]
MTAKPETPYYILVSHSCQNPNAPTPTLTHPTIQYHYADDMPLHILPTSRDEQVLVLDRDPLHPEFPRGQSITGNIAVTGVKVTDAPGVGADDDPEYSNRMFILETTKLCDERPSTEHMEPDAVLARFRQRHGLR